MSKTTITFLGTSSVVPASGHDTASFVINGSILVDCGWYAPLRMKSYGLDPMKIESLILTHCHHDHYLGLPQLLFHLAMRRADVPNRPPLRIVGPAADLSTVIELSKKFLQQSRFPDAVFPTDLVALTAGSGYECDAFRLATCESKHPVPALCYRFTDKATGANLAFTGDTAPHEPIIKHVRGVSLLIHEASYGADPAPKENKWGHSGAPDAARIALEAKVKRLALVHCAEEDQPAALAAAKKTFPNTFWPADGKSVTIDG